MTQDEDSVTQYPLSPGVHYFVVGEPSFLDREMGVHMTEFGPFRTRAEAVDALLGIRLLD